MVLFHKNPLSALNEKSTWMAIAVAIWGWGIIETDEWKHYICGAATLCGCIAAMIKQSVPPKIPETTCEDKP